MQKTLSIMIDEAGRGPLAGPVTVGVAMQRKKIPLAEYNDSKQLTQKKREKLYTAIIKEESKNKLFTGVGWGSVKKIDKYGIIIALREATIKGIFMMLKKFYTQIWSLELKQSGNNKALHTLDKIFLYRRVGAKTINTLFTYIQETYQIKHILIDGNNDFGLDNRLIACVETIVKGDQKNKYISIASIVAKVVRDKYMRNLHKKYPKYGFNNHVGYGTLKHTKAIQNLGITSIHRKTFCRNIQSTFK